MIGSRWIVSCIPAKDRARLSRLLQFIGDDPHPHIEITLVGDRLKVMYRVTRDFEIPKVYQPRWYRWVVQTACEAILKRKGVTAAIITK